MALYQSLLGLFFVGVLGDDSSRVCVADGSCDEDAPAMLQTRERFHNHEETRAPGTPPGADESEQMRAKITGRFGAVDGGGYLATNVGVLGTPSSWGFCVGIDYSKQNCLKTSGSFLCNGSSAEVLEQLRQLSVEDCNKETGKYKDDPTCVALWAVVDSYSDLTLTFPSGPAFANYLVTNWGKTTTDETLRRGWPSPSYNSWRDGGFSVEDTPSSELPKGSWEPLPAPWGKGNAANGFGLCDLVRTVLQQNNNQVGTGTCGPTSVLAALNRRNPAKALRLATELTWTGTLSTLPAHPCKYIYKSQPGLIDIPSDTATGIKDCVAAGGNEGDCANAAGQPYQAVGLEYVWTQAMLSSYSDSVNGACSKDGGLDLNAPNDSPDEKLAITYAQMSGPQTVQYTCMATIGDGSTDCKWNVNTAICGDTLSQSDCQRLTALPGLTGRELGPLAGSGDPAATVHQLAQTSPPFRAFYGEIIEAAGGEQQGGSALLHLLSVVSPSLTPELLTAACSAKYTMLFVAGDVFNPLRMHPELAGATSTEQVFQAVGQQAPTQATNACDHWVFLEECAADSNEVTIWTWGSAVKTTRELVLGSPVNGGPHTTGIVCGFISA